MTDPQSSDLLNAVFVTAVDAIVVATKEGQIICANASAERLFGYNGSELAGQSINILMPPQMSDQHDAFLQEHLRTGAGRISGTTRPVEGLRRDGATFPLQISVIQAECNGSTVFFAIMHDLTAKRAIQQVNSRSQRLDAIVRMSDRISHDFNNLLTIIIGNLELATAKINDDATRAMIDDALEAAEHCADLTRRMSQFARHGYLKPEITDISAACMSAKVVLEPSLGAEYVLTCKPTEAILNVNVDPNKLQTAIINLVVNARDAMPTGGEITISNAIVLINDTAQEIDAKRGTYVCVSVTDCGTGMSAGAQLRAFEPFYTTKPLSRGTGLGLSMVHGFARQSQGFVKVRSNQGHGSTVSIYLPLATGTTTAPPRDITTMRGHNQRVLVVESNVLTCDRIEALGYRTLFAETADRALEVLNLGYKIDALLTDLITPNSRDGFDLALLARSNFPDLKIILTTSHDKSAFDNNTLLTAPFDILPKPYGQEDLAACLHAAFAGH